LPSYVSPTELLSITTFEDPNKDVVIGVYIIDSKDKKKWKNNEKVSNEETENKDDAHKMDIEDNNSKQNLKKRKYSEKSLVTDESDIKVKKKKKEAADQNIIDQLDEKKKAKPESEDKDNTDNEVDVADNNGRQSLKKRKYSSEKSFITDESKKKKKEVNQSITDQRNEKEKISKEDATDKNNICEEMDAADNIDSQSIKKGKYVTDENDIKIKKKRKTADQNMICQQNEKEKVTKQSEDEDNTYDNEIDASYNNDKQYSKKEKYALEKLLVVDESDIKVKKRRKTIDQTDQQNEKEKMPKEEHEDRNNTYDNKIDTADNNSRQNLKKRKLAPEESYIKDEKNIKVTENSNIENQDISIKNRNKVIEKKKRKFTINDTITEDISDETVKKVCQKPVTNSNKNKTTELEYPYEGDESNETNALLQTEEHSMSDFGMRNSDIEETSIDERKKKKNRKKRSKIQDNICSKIGLQIMAKSDWKRLRNRYLDLQRHKMSQLKMHLRKAEVERGGIMTKNGYHDKIGQNNTSHDKLKYENDNRKFEEEKSYGHVNYTPGIIVKIEMDEPCTDLQGFKVHRY